MEKRKDALSTLKICRFCLAQDVPMASLYDSKRRKLKNTVNLPLKILSCVSIEVYPSDKMPVFICERCKYFMNLCYDFKQICHQADETILHYVQENKTLKPITWPIALNDVYRESNSIGVMKTIVEDGTTVQVTHDISESEADDEENVYNVKVNDGSEEEAKACIKVVTSRENPQNEVSKQTSKGEGERCWACNECNATYPLQQMLELHKLRKHRQRNVQCDMCDDKFFSKYDLAIHQLRHSGEMPFKCFACNKKFRRLIQLKRHEKLIHPDLEQLKCENCPASFLSKDELLIHKKKHKRSTLSYSCNLCTKTFQVKSNLRRHLQFIHNKALQFACEYCPQRFPSLTSLSTHVRTHAGERPYPCKYCDKSFTKSHHLSRHVRMKHRDSERARASSGGEQYRCDQCDVSFGNQDELIYHSAIHATQNLICPLCQEKFDSVDAVTTHIKSHVNGVEFMCDFCELVFTTKEKLDNHLMIAHEDEIQNELGLDEISMDAEDPDIDVEGDVDDDAEEEDDDTCINVKEEDGHMVVEIKKAEDFMIRKHQATNEPKPQQTIEDHSNSEESGSESLQAFTQMATLNKVTRMHAPPKIVAEKQPERATIKPVLPVKTAVVAKKPEENKPSSIQRQVIENSAVRKEKSKIETASDKSLRLLEKELQDLKRTNSRSEAVKTPVKSLEAPRSRGRPALHTSTPKIKPAEEKKSQGIKTPLAEKKPVEKKLLTKENKEPKEGKETKLNSKEDDNKSAIKNGTSDKSATDDGIRRSTRPSKIKDYAKMIRDNSQEESDSEEHDDDEEYVQEQKSPEVQRIKARRISSWQRRSSIAVAPAPTPPAPQAAAPGSALTPPAPTRKRGRPRKEPAKETPAKLKKSEPGSESEAVQEKSSESDEKIVEPKQPNEPRNKTAVLEPEIGKMNTEVKIEVTDNSNSPEPNQSTAEEHNASFNDPKLVSPTGQPLKKVPIKYLPPGVKPLPLPLVGRSLPSGELCEMQIGKKVVKVQKIVMTKAEVEEMAKKGLVEMKGGTMVLKQGIKLPKSDSVTIKAIDGNNAGKKTLMKKEKALPTRCDMGDD